MNLTIKIAFLLTICAAVAVAIAGPGVRLGLWEYGTGLAIFRGMKFPAIILAVIAMVLTFITWRHKSHLTTLALVSTLIATFSAYGPIRFDQLVANNPLIHDITTDFGNPPEIEYGASQPRKNPAGYDGTEMAPNSTKTIAEAQKEALPEIQPLKLDMSVEQVADMTREAIANMNMKLVASHSSSGETALEATYTSYWFGFTDGFVVRLTQESHLTRVDVRSKSRLGVSDLGANARRIMDFFAYIN